MSEYKLTEEQIAEFREMFDMMDKDKGGTLGADEVKQLMDMLGVKMRADELDAMIAEIDTDRSGQIEFEEFLQVMAKPQDLPYARSDVMRAFQMFCRSDDPPGHIHPEALEQALIKYGGNQCTQEDILRLVNTITAGPNGLIDFQSKVTMFVPK